MRVAPRLAILLNSYFEPRISYASLLQHGKKVAWGACPLFGIVQM
jgi:hypothetical protein